VAARVAAMERVALKAGATVVLKATRATVAQQALVLRSRER
jgi:hypothetical protein